MMCHISPSLAQFFLSWEHRRLRIAMSTVGQRLYLKPIHIFFQRKAMYSIAIFHLFESAYIVLNRPRTIYLIPFGILHLKKVQMLVLKNSRNVNAPCALDPVNLLHRIVFSLDRYKSLSIEFSGHQETLFFLLVMKDSSLPREVEERYVRLKDSLLRIADIN